MIVGYEGAFPGTIVTVNIDKQVEVRTMVMSGPKSRKYPEQCDKTFYNLIK